MAIITTGNNFGATDAVTNTKLNDIANAATFDDPADETSIEKITSGAGLIGKLGIKDEGVTLAKMQHIGTDKVLGRTSENTGDVEEVGIIIGSSGDAGLLFDNDDMLDNSDTAGGSATRGATQQSIQAYTGSLDTEPVNLTLLNGAVAYGADYEVPSYYRTRDNIVHLRGLLIGSTANDVVASLPSGFRPAKRLLFSAPDDSVAARIDIHAAGNIEVQSGVSSYNSLDGISFLADGS